MNMTIEELKTLDAKLSVPMFTSVLTEVEFPLLVDYIIFLHGNEKIKFKEYVECEEYVKYQRIKRIKRKRKNVCYSINILRIEGFCICMIL